MDTVNYNENDKVYNVDEAIWMRRWLAHFMMKRWAVRTPWCHIW